MVNNDPAFSTDEAAKRLGLSSGTLRNQRSLGSSPISWVKIASVAVLYTDTELRKYEAILAERAHKRRSS